MASVAFITSCARKAAPPTTVGRGRAPTFNAVAAARRCAATATATNITISKNSNNNANLRSFRKVINSRISARRFQPNTPIPNAVWKDILSMTLTSPSGFNLQPTHILLLRDAHLKSILSEHAMLGMGNKYRTLDASGIAIFCTDLMPGRRIDRIYQLESESGVRDDGYMAVMKVASSFLTGEGSAASGGNCGNSDDNSGSSQNRISTFLKRTFAHALSPIQPMPTMEDVESWSYKNAGIMSSIYTLSATAHGLSTCMMEGYDARRVKEILRVPDRYGIPLMVATGYEYRGEATDDAMANLTNVVHADFLAGDGVADEEEDASRAKRKTPRLGMREVFFGDTFGAPLDFLLDNHIIEKVEDAA